MRCGKLGKVDPKLGHAHGSAALLAATGLRDAGMDQLHDFLEAVRRHAPARGQLRGLLHVLIGRRITRIDGTAVSAGLTWREAAALLKRLRWEPEKVRELGLDPDDLPVRDRERFWYSVIARAAVDSLEAVTAGDRLVKPLAAHGFVIGPAPGGEKKD